MSIIDEFRNIGKHPVVAQIGGFRPDENIISSFGGGFLQQDQVEWPRDSNGLMIPIIQIKVSEIPNGVQYFGDVELVQVYLSASKIPNSGSVNGDGWLLNEYKCIDNLRKVPTPEECSTYREFQIKWDISKKADYPCWEESWCHMNMSEVNDSIELTNQFFEEFSRYPSTKIGGYAAYIQSPIEEVDDYIFQISSEEKPHFMLGDNGKMYICKSKATNEWYLEWDCY